ncbi:MAG: altronate hydrolase, partial [Chloroflexi bacterium]
MALRFADIARLPAPGDNTAIATRRIGAGSVVDDGRSSYTIDSTVPEGHRFAAAPIPAGEALRSWGLPFGYALRPIAAGEYLRNDRMLQALRLREVEFPLPDEPNFRDTALEPYSLDPARFQPAPPTERAPAGEMRWFQGYLRGGGRGVGTRNDIVVLATTSRTGAWARALAERLRGATDGVANVDDIVAVTHTEGGAGSPNNLQLLLRTLAGFVVHPNVGAVLIVERGDEAVSNTLLRRYLREHGYLLDDVLHRFVTLRDTFENDLERGEELLRGWIPRVAAQERSPQPVSALRIGLQCGGSDAFSGVSGNPLAAWAAHEIIRHGGAANLAETDELIGAEAYILQRVRDLATAERFLATIERFKERVGWHGHTAEGNPSGGNLYRGLYNIAIKSIGAAMKRDPRTRLDHVIEYGELMRAPGYYFMDSPGNDLESIAGQVASGCNMLLFVTGNGSITNFPFVPTIKIVTTSERFRLLADDMDINAGAYLDGVPMATLGEELTERICVVASGTRSVGELAAHSQVSIWRDWPQTGPVDLNHLIALARPRTGPLLQQADIAPESLPEAERALLGATFSAIETARGPRNEQVGLILPTSICSGQVALRIAARRNAALPDDPTRPLSRVVALAHTEGC